MNSSEDVINQFFNGKAGSVDSKESRSGFVALIGRANVGKSTLMNRIIGQKIAITSPKPQTTRGRIRTVYTSDRGQIVFIDTPGIHKARTKLGDYMVGVAEGTMKEVDLVLWLIEPAHKIGDGEKNIIAKLKEVKSPVFLIINKTDTCKRDELLPLIDSYRKELDFTEIVPVCARKGDNVDTLVDLIYDHLPEGPAFYPEDTLTDQPMKQIVSEIIREKGLRCLGDEIPHGIAVGIDQMKQSGNLWEIDATIYCDKDSHKGMIIGKGGSKLKEIGSEARPEIESLLESKVNLKLWVKVKKGWRDSDFLLKNFGYKDE